MNYVLTAFRNNTLIDLQVFEGKPSKKMLLYTLNRSINWRQTEFPHEVNYCAEYLLRHGELESQMEIEGVKYWFRLEMKIPLPVNPERWVTILKIDRETDIETNDYQPPSLQELRTQFEDVFYYETGNTMKGLPFKEVEKVNKLLQDVHKNVNDTFEIELLGRRVVMLIMKENWNPAGNFWVSE